MTGNINLCIGFAIRTDFLNLLQLLNRKRENETATINPIFYIFVKNP